jgi:hypothetical protein
MCREEKKTEVLSGVPKSPKNTTVLSKSWYFNLCFACVNRTPFGFQYHKIIKYHSIASKLQKYYASKHGLTVYVSRQCGAIYIYLYAALSEPNPTTVIRLNRVVRLILTQNITLLYCFVHMFLLRI